MTDESKLKPVEGEFWYKLATIGTKNGKPNMNDIYWNQAMEMLAEHMGVVIPSHILKTVISSKKKTLEQIAQDVRVKGDIITNYNSGEFRNTIDFSHLHFKKEFNARGFVFPANVTFADSKFSEPAIFSDATFIESTCFDHTTFRYSVFFRETSFLSDVNFQKSIFEGIADFDNSKWNSETSFKGADFRDSPPSFFDAEISTTIKWQNIKLPTQNKTLAYFGKILPFSKKGRKNLIQDVKIYYFELLSWVCKLKKEGWGSIKQDYKSIKEAKQSKYRRFTEIYENLARHMENLGRWHDRYFFFRHEMHTREKTGEMRWFEIYISRIYRGLADYGHGIGRAASYWGLHIIAGGIVQFLTLPFTKEQSGLEKIYESLAFSFSNAHSFLGLRRNYFNIKMENADAYYWANFFGYWQTIIGVILLFFLLLTLRNRFRIG